MAPPTRPTHGLPLVHPWIQPGHPWCRACHQPRSMQESSIIGQIWTIRGSVVDR